MLATPESPVYTKQDSTPEGQATKQFTVWVDEGWKSWPLCDGMYEWAADGLIDMIQGHPAPQAPESTGVE